jgi:hypothetical protein
MKAFDDDGTELVRCRSCTGGHLIVECCSGAGGCDCHGQEVDMGPCRVCQGTMWHKPDVNTRANLDSMRGMLFAGSGPTSGMWAGKKWG